ncbi:hypothetical protein CLAFUW4_08017 [Fulvia fulva]|uniref:Uncharacterized protein n=1 Tax=Passalora fulva TaxID=5499 RepID=A0A9Q8LE43_PASFU|nr:uncharacterized protein CLAFUR5_08136 [Fulvia fulva]KAK4628751.1 hypothetical protein CLAFUR4_08022 [Fulvia fulva]KAK4630574.1 hypothetical protein CLAFUR0_08017 [Fulvia fulva]UJO15008.1 hypothetical protein CLAFUR5_08136 [Fulvia fulva]WPV12973.1 hypothetical protein CLAFUW4_08017 [Fulvia fulva]WPV27100.1 hypothetical protein CLAFUW7_08017 [Fulvia fulva]
MSAIRNNNAVLPIGTQARYVHDLFLTYSRINRPCRPNADIKAGKELTTTYMLNIRSEKQRQEQLQEGCGFKRPSPPLPTTPQTAIG